MYPHWYEFCAPQSRVFDDRRAYVWRTPTWYGHDSGPGWGVMCGGSYAWISDSGNICMELWPA